MSIKGPDGKAPDIPRVLGVVSRRGVEQLRELIAEHRSNAGDAYVESAPHQSSDRSPASWRLLKERRRAPSSEHWREYWQNMRAWSARADGSGSGQVIRWAIDAIMGFTIDAESNAVISDVPKRQDEALIGGYQMEFAELADLARSFSDFLTPAASPIELGLGLTALLAAYWASHTAREDSGQPSMHDRLTATLRAAKCLEKGLHMGAEINHFEAAVSLSPYRERSRAGHVDLKNIGHGNEHAVAAAFHAIVRSLVNIDYAHTPAGARHKNSALHRARQDAEVALDSMRKRAPQLIGLAQRAAFGASLPSMQRVLSMGVAREGWRAFMNGMIRGRLGRHDSSARHAAMEAGVSLEGIADDATALVSQLMNFLRADGGRLFALDERKADFVALAYGLAQSGMKIDPKGSPDDISASFVRLSSMRHDILPIDIDENAARTVGVDAALAHFMSRVRHQYLFGFSSLNAYAMLAHMAAYLDRRPKGAADLEAASSRGEHNPPRDALDALIVHGNYAAADNLMCYVMDRVLETLTGDEQVVLGAFVQLCLATLRCERAYLADDADIRIRALGLARQALADKRMNNFDLSHETLAKNVPPLIGELKAIVTRAIDAINMPDPTPGGGVDGGLTGSGQRSAHGPRGSDATAPAAAVSGLPNRAVMDASPLHAGGATAMHGAVCAMGCLTAPSAAMSGMGTMRMVLGR